jgi:hypothetical protein
MQTQTQSQRIVSLIEYQAQREQTPSGFAVTCYTLATFAALYCLSVFLFSL